MKRVILIITILLLASIMILAVSFGKNRLNKKYDLIEFDNAIVDLVDNKAVSDIKYKKFKFTNIHFEDRILKFDLIGDKEELITKTVVVSIFNDFAKNPGNVVSAGLSELKDEITEIDDGYSFNLDIGDSYNNPYRIKIELK